MKKILALLLAIMMLFSLAACGTSEEAPADTSTPDQDVEPITLKFSYANNSETTAGAAALAWAEAITEATEGRVQIDVYPNGQLYSSLTEEIEAVELGLLDMALVDASLLVDYLPELNLLCQPMLFDGFESWERIMSSDIVDGIRQHVGENTNMRILGFVFMGFRNCIITKEINSMEDCKGVIIRSPETDVYLNTLSRLNFTPTPLSFSEIYTAMESGVVQGTETTYEYMYTQSYCEVAKQLIESCHIASNNCVIMNNGTWDKISAEDQDVILELYDEYMWSLNSKINDESEGWKQKLIDEYDCNVYYYTDEEKAVILERFQEYWNESASQHGFEDLLAQVLEIR